MLKRLLLLTSIILILFLQLVVCASAENIAELPAGYELEENGLIRVNDNGNYGYIDKNGKTIIPICYEHLNYYSDDSDYLIAKFNGAWGVLNKSGGTVIPFEYQDIRTWDEIFVAQKNNKYGAIDTEGKITIPFVYDCIYEGSENLAAARIGDTYSYINKYGNAIAPFIYENAYFYKFQNGMVLVEKDGKLGAINQYGDVVVPIKYALPRTGDIPVGAGNEFKDSRLAVLRSGKCGFIDEQGKEVIELKYDFVQDFEEGLARVKLNDKWGFVDTNGNEIIPIIYDEAFDFHNGIAKVNLNGKYGFIDAENNILLPLEYDFIGDLHENIYRVRKNEKYGYFNEEFKSITPIIYEGASFFVNGYATVKKNNKWGAIDSKGNVIIPLEYSGLGDFGDGLFAAKGENGKWGYIDLDNQLVIPYEYKYAMPFTDGFAEVSFFGFGYEIGMINKSNVVVIPFLYNDISNNGNAIVCNYGEKTYVRVNHYISMNINNPVMNVDATEKYIDVDKNVVPVIIGGRTMLPIRAIIETMGGEILWDEMTQAITIRYNNNLIVLNLNQYIANVNGQNKTLEVAPTVLNGRTVLPLRFVAENLGCDVFWENNTQRVLITY